MSCNLIVNVKNTNHSAAAPHLNHLLDGLNRTSRCQIILRNLATTRLVQKLKIIISYSATNQATHSSISISCKDAHQSYSGHHGVPSKQPSSHLSLLQEDFLFTSNGANKRRHMHTERSSSLFPNAPLIPLLTNPKSQNTHKSQNSLHMVLLLYIFHVVICRRPEPHSTPTSPHRRKIVRGTMHPPSLPKSRNPCTSRFRTSKARLVDHAANFSSPLRLFLPSSQCHHYRNYHHVSSNFLIPYEYYLCLRLDWYYHHVPQISPSGLRVLVLCHVVLALV
jgi:hypothetical protein